MVEELNLNEDSPSVRTHLEMMQGVINRMAANSRSCKFWCVTLVAATLFLVARADDPWLALIALVPTVLFFVLDSYYLALERAFIKSHSMFVGKLHEGELNRRDIYKVAPTGMSLRLVVQCFGSVSIYLFYPLVITTILLATWLIQ